MMGKEKLTPPKEPVVAAPMAARAVALCEGCPMAKFCAIKAVAPCETPVEQAVQIESAGGGYDGAMLDKPVQTSYRKELMDDTQPFVMANLQKKKESPPKPKQAPMRPAPKPHAVSPRAQRPTPKVTPPKPAAMPRPKPERRESGSGDVIADILLSMIATRSDTTRRSKKSV